MVNYAELSNRYALIIQELALLCANIKTSDSEKKSAFRVEDGKVRCYLGSRLAGYLAERDRFSR